MGNVNTYIKDNAYQISKSWLDKDIHESNDEIIEENSSFFGKLKNKVVNKLSTIANSQVLIAPIDKKYLDNASKAFQCDDFSSILAIFDHTLAGSCEEGLLFTGTKMIQKVILTDPVTLIYEEMDSAKYGAQMKLDKNGDEKLDYEYVEIIFKDAKKENFIIKELTDCDYLFLSDFINEILKHETFKDENQLKIIADMPEPLKAAYLKIMINMVFLNDEQIDSKELAEIFLLMDRIELGMEARFDVRSYLASVNSNNLTDLQDLLNIIKENSEESQLKTIMISAIKDIVNIHFISLGDYKSANIKDIEFIQNNKTLFNLDDNDIELAFEAVKNDYSMLYDNLDDDKIKTLMKDLSAKAASVGVPLGAVYISGSVIGLGATGITSGLATLGMGGVLGLSSMATGIGVAVLLGVGAYQGVKHISGANEITKYKQRELMLHEAIKQTQKSICNIIEDINYMISELNNVKQNDETKQAKIAQLEKMISAFTRAAKSMVNKQDNYQNSENRLKCPDVLDIERLKNFTSEPTKQEMFNFIMNYYEEITLNEDNKQKVVIKLKNNLNTQTLEKMVNIFTAIGYFDMSNIIKSKAQDGINETANFVKEILK